MKYAFFDTNVFLHFTQFDDPTWRTALETSAVTIVVPAQVVAEIDRHADGYSRNRRVQERAAKVKRLFNELIETSSPSGLGMLAQTRTEGTAVLFLATDPQLDFARHQLKYDRADDQILAAVIEFGPQLGPAVVVSNDTGIRLKCKQRGINIFMPPQGFAMPLEADPNEQEVRRLQAELRKYELRRPNLLLQIKDAGQFTTFKVRPPLDITEAEFRQKNEEARTAFPLYSTEQTDSNATPRTLLSQSAFGRMNRPDDNDIARYNRQIHEFYEENDAYARAFAEHVNLRKRTIFLDLVLVNNGTLPANDVRVHLHFPDGFELRDAFPEQPTKPEPPQRPMSLLEMISRRGSESIFPSMYLPDYSGISAQALSRPNVTLDGLKQTNSYDVNFSVEKAQHGGSENLNRLYVVFESYSSARGFEVQYRISADDLIEPCEGKLNIHVEKDDSIR